MKTRARILGTLTAFLLLATSAAGTVLPAQAAASGLEPITLSFGYVEGTSNNVGIVDGEILKAIAEATGVTLDLRPYSVEKYKMLVAGGDLPDIATALESHVSGVTQQLIEAGAIIPLDDLLDKYGQHLKANIPLALKWAKDVQGNGVTYTLPTGCTKADTSSPDPYGDFTFEMRWDIYEAIGSPEIKSDEDFLKVAKMMQDYCPVSPEGYKVYAFSGFITNGPLWQYKLSWPRAHGSYWAPVFHQIDMFTGELESMYTKEDSYLWKSLEFHNKAYQMGLFDPEALTMTFEQYDEKLQTGQVLFAAFQQRAVNQTLIPGGLFAKHPGITPYIHKLYPMGNPLGNQAGHARVISSNCKYPERAMQLLDFLDSPEGVRLLLNGVKGKHWDVVDGVPQYIGEFAEAFKAGKGKEYYAQVLGMDYDAIFSFFSGNIAETGDEYPADLRLTPAFYALFADEAARNWAKKFDPGFTYRGQVYEKWYKEGLVTTAADIPLAVNMMGALSAESTNVQAKIDSYFGQNLGKVLLAKDDAEFQKNKQELIAEFYAMGAADSDAEVQKLFQQAEALVASLDQ